VKVVVPTVMPDSPKAEGKKQLSDEEVGAIQKKKKEEQVAINENKRVEGIMKEIKTEEKETKEDRKRMDDIQGGMKKDTKSDKAAKVVISTPASKERHEVDFTSAEKWTGIMLPHIITGNKGLSEIVTTSTDKIDSNAPTNVKPEKPVATVKATAADIKSSEFTDKDKERNFVKAIGN
jgi:hypothetical protein